MRYLSKINFYSEDYQIKDALALHSEDITCTVTLISTAVSSTCTITGANNTGKSETIIYTNASQDDLIVTVPTTYNTPEGLPIELTCPAGGYCEVNYVNVNGNIYARGL